MEYLKLSALVGTLVYSVLGVLILCITFWIIDKITPYDLWAEIIEKKNVALAIVVGAVALAIGQIVAAAIHG
jgi:uncharacterized membrane protein YjfL (UPF0719 family)